jgi:hypothetical protein
MHTAIRSEIELARGYVAFLIVFASPLPGQTLGLEPSRGTSPESSAQITDQLGRTTPRGTMVAFIRAVHRDDFISAARYMEVNDKQKSKTELLARDLRELMNRYFNQPLEAISDSPWGRLDDTCHWTVSGLAHSRSATSEST